METVVDRELLLEFLLTFSALEYALKTTEYLGRRPRNGRRGVQGQAPLAEPNWSGFAASLRGRFREDRTPQIQEACEFIVQAPPWQQVVLNDQVGWEAGGPPIQQRGVQFILLMVRRVRNNLFHGGKHSGDPHQTKARTELLLRRSLVILAECLRLSPRVRRAYDQAVL